MSPIKALRTRTFLASTASGYTPEAGGPATAVVSSYTGYSMFARSGVVGGSAYLAYISWKQLNGNAYQCNDAQSIDIRTAQIAGGIAITPNWGCTIYFDKDWFEYWRYHWNYSQGTWWAEASKEDFCSVMAHEAGHSWLHIGHSDHWWGAGLGPVMSGRGYDGAYKTQACQNHWNQYNVN
jgi:hypothetical protein